MNRYTIRDYGNYLEMECGMYPYQTSLWKTKRIDETKGIVDEYLPIAEELYEALMNEEPVPFNDDNSYLQYAILDYKFKQDDLFMASCNIVVLTGTDKPSIFQGRDVEILNDSKKMIGGKFIIRINDKFLNSESGRGEFFEEMAHELQHAYRFYNIFLSNNSYTDEEKTKIERNKKAYTIQTNTSNLIEYNVSVMYYLSDRNEISSESNRLYEYIRNHTEINDSNVNDFYNDDLPLWLAKTALSDFIEELDSNLKADDMEYVRKVGETFKKVIGDKKMTPSRAFIKFRTRVIDAAMFADRLFNRTLSKAFDDFNRRMRMLNGTDAVREMIETDKDYELLREILNRH